MARSPHLGVLVAGSVVALSLSAQLAVSASAAPAGSAPPAPPALTALSGLQPRVSAQPPGAVAASTTALSDGSHRVAFSPTSFFTADISRAPLARNSAKVVKNLASQVSSAWGGIAAFNAYQYNASFYRVPSGTPRVDVAFTDCQHRGYTPHGLYDGAAHFRSVPVPSGALASVGTDKTVTIYDPAADQLWEFWRFEASPAGGWQACWGGRIDHVSTSQGSFPGVFGASASGIAMAGGMIRIDEIARGRIDHAMYLGVRSARSWRYFSWPARRSDGSSTSGNVVMQGQRLRLDPRVNLSKLRLTRVGLMVAKAAQTYGFYVSDLSGAVAVITESGKIAEASDGRDPWRTLLGGPSYLVLKNFPWGKLQALPKDYGKPRSS